MLCIMSERHGGEKPTRVSPLWRAERSELMQKFCDERALALKRQGAERGGVVQPGLEHPPVTREPVGSNPIAPAAKILAARFSRLK